MVAPRSSLSSSTRRSAKIPRAAVMLAVLLFFVAGYFYLSYGVMQSMKQQHQQQHRRRNVEFHQNAPPGKKHQLASPAEAQGARGAAESHDRNGSASDHARRTNDDKCAFRSYPPNRLYGLSDSRSDQPQFLSEAAYIRGQWPTILNPKEDDQRISTTDGKRVIQQTTPVKVCIDTASWEDTTDRDGTERLPFTDGHNPSVISLASNPYDDSGSSDKQHMRLEPRHLEPLASALSSNTASLDSLFLGVTIFGGGQCKFGFTPEEVDTYRFNLKEEPSGGKRAVIAVLSPPNTKGGADYDGSSSSDPPPFQTLVQATLLLERDAEYGRKRAAIHPEKTPTGGFARMHQEFDDPRLFFHLGRVWVLYRNGPLFGYSDQIHNPVHFEEVPSGEEDGAKEKFVAYVKASETVRVGGGRNIALISEEPIGINKNGEVEWVPSPSLKALTWVDPVTVKEGIDLGGVEAKLSNNRRLLEGVGDVSIESGQERANLFAENLPSHYQHTQQHRRLGSKPDKSHIHGTNGYMVPLISTGELLGIAHFHRPEDRKGSDFALHGHHYTHAFFTIARQASENAEDTKLRPFKLKRLSNEFVFRANSIPDGETQPPVDGDIIQFASGLDVVGSDVDGQLIISYGINDCEGGVFTLTMQKVQRMLIGVESGQEVVDLMKNVLRR